MDASKLPDQPWARLQVVRGAIPDRRLFSAGRPVQLRVGSDPDADLCLPVKGIAPRQLELAWDGAALWLQDPLRLGRTLVNGRPLNEWLLVQGQVLVACGEVRLWLATSALFPVPMAPNFAALELARKAELSGACRRSPTVRLPNDELSSEQLEDLLSGGVGS